ncbi:MAG: PAS domain S-box protein, partial [Candidatus Cryosericum sp.]
MNALDIRTILIGFLTSEAICCLVIVSLWLQHRRHSRGLGLWGAGFAMQTLSVLLIALRGFVPDFVSIVAGNGLNVLGAIVVFIGLEQYLNRRGPQLQNWAALAVFAVVQAYFGLVHPILTARTVNLSVALLFVCVQCAWLMLHRAEARLRPATRSAGLVFAAYALVGVIRVPVTLLMPSNADFLHSGPVDAVVLLTYQILSLALTFTLLLMVNRRMAAVLEEDITRRELLEEELRRSEEKFSLAFHGIPDAIMLTTQKDGTIIDINDSFSRVTGYGRAEAVGKTTVDLKMWSSETDRRNRLIEPLTSHGSVQRVELEFPRKSGETFEGWISSQVLTLPQGASVLSVLHDMTDQRRLEREIDRERKQLQAVFDSVPGIMYLYDDQESLILWNKKHEELTGYSAEELSHMRLSDWYKGDEQSLAAVAEGVRKTVADGSGDAEALLQRKDGTTVPMYLTAVRLDIDGRHYITGIGLDITDRKQAEKALLESERRYRVLFENMTTGFALHEMVYDAQGRPIDYRFLAVNPAFERLTGMPAEYLIGRTVLEAMPGTEHSWIDTYAEVTRTGVPKLLSNYSAALGKWYEVQAFSPSAGRFATIFSDVTERKRAEEALSRSEALLNEVQEVSHIGGWEYDVRTHDATWTKEVYRIHELPNDYDPSDIGRDIAFYAESDREQMSDAFYRAVTSGEPYDMELRFVTAKGNRRWVRTMAQPELQDGKPARIVGILADITERKQMEQEHGRLATMLERSLNEIYVFDSVSLRFTFVNEGALRNLGYSLAEMKEMTPVDIKPLFTEESFRATVRPLIDREKPRLFFETVHRRKDGTRYPVEVHLQLVGDGDQSMFLAIINDTTERAKLQLELAHMASFPVQNPSPVVEIAVDGSLRSANPASTAALVRLGLEPDARQFLSLKPEELTQLRSQCELTPVSDELLLGTATFLRAITASPGEDTLRVYAVDITERKRAEAEKQAIQRQLLQSQKMEAIGQLAGGVAHDFNNLLTGILGNIALVRSGLPPADPLHENLAAAETAARNAADLTRGLLTFSRSAMVLPVPLSAAKTVGETVDLLRQSLPATIEIIRDFRPDAWNILADRSQVTQILLNLAVNARDAMQGEGTITLTVRN